MGSLDPTVFFAHVILIPGLAGPRPSALLVTPSPHQGAKKPELYTLDRISPSLRFYLLLNDVTLFF